jgi:hypothetical protein
MFSALKITKAHPFIAINHLYESYLEANLNLLLTQVQEGYFFLFKFVNHKTKLVFEPTNP